MIWGGTMFGNWASGSPRTAMMPTITMMIEITIATMGRLMKKLEIIAGASSTGLASAKFALEVVKGGAGPAMVGSAPVLERLAPVMEVLALAQVGLALAKA